jgi:hypothetical protein
MATRAQNERNFRYWDDRPTGGRRYWKDYPGRHGGWARYVKIVDAEETTLLVVQEIYDHDGVLIEVHEKFPVDKGHRKV